MYVAPLSKEIGRQLSPVRIFNKIIKKVYRVWAFINRRIQQSEVKS